MPQKLKTNHLIRGSILNVIGCVAIATGVISGLIGFCVRLVFMWVHKGSDNQWVDLIDNFLTVFGLMAVVGILLIAMGQFFLAKVEKIKE